MKDNFDALFGDLYIGKHPTEELLQVFDFEIQLFKYIILFINFHLKYKNNYLLFDIKIMQKSKLHK